MVIGEAPAGASRIDQAFTKIETMFERLASGQTGHEKRLDKIELIAISKEDLSSLRAELYKHVGQIIRENNENQDEKFGEKVNHARGAILADVDKLGGELHRAVAEGIAEGLKVFIERDLPQIIEAQLVARDERKEAERERKIGKIKTRLAIGTAAVLFFASLLNFYLTAKGKDNSAAVGVQKSVTQLEKLVK